LTSSGKGGKKSRCTDLTSSETVKGNVETRKHKMWKTQK